MIRSKGQISYLPMIFGLVAQIVLAVFGAADSEASRVIGEGVTVGGAAALCRITQVNPVTRDWISYCTGTLVSPREIVTSAHCFANLLNTGDPRPRSEFRIQCGYDATSAPADLLPQRWGDFLFDAAKFAEEAEVQKISLSTAYDQQRQDSSFWIGRYGDELGAIGDYARILLKKPARAAPIAIAPLPTFFDRGRLRPNTECQVSGFGRAQSYLGGVLHSGKVDMRSLRSVMDKVISFMIDLPPPGIVSNTYSWSRISKVPGLKLFYEDLFTYSTFARFAPSAYITPGDSGGPLLCHSKGDPVWNVVGINSGSMLTPRYEYQVVDGQETTYTMRFTYLSQKWSVPNLTGALRVVYYSPDSGFRAKSPLPLRPKPAVSRSRPRTR